MADNHHPEAPSLEMGDDSFDSDCYILSESEADDAGSEAIDPMSPMPYGDEDDEMFEVSELEYGSSIGEAVEVISSDEEDVNKADVQDEDQEIDTDSEEEDDICNFGPEVPDKIVWDKPMFSKRVLEVRRKVERAWRARNEKETRTINWGL